MAKRADVLGEVLLSNGRFRLTRMLVEIEEQDGEKRRIDHEIYHYGRAAAVLPYDAERRVVLLVRQFRLAAFLATGALDLLEAPAGPGVGREVERRRRAGVELRLLRLPGRRRRRRGRIGRIRRSRLQRVGIGVGRIIGRIGDFGRLVDQRAVAFAVDEPDIVDRVLDAVQAGTVGEHPAAENAL